MQRTLLETKYCLVFLTEKRSRATMDIWSFEDLGIISDFEEEEEANESCPGNWMKPTMPTAHRDGDRPHPPWEGHRDKLIGIVDMGR